MPWGEVTVSSLRFEFVRLASQPEANVRQLCRRFGISPKTGYKWLGRFAGQGTAGLADQSRRPLHSPARSDGELERRVVALRDCYPDWGGRKLRALLRNDGLQEIPSASTITAILRRHGRLDPARAGKPAAWQRFEHEAPNQLWQMDFKGDFPLVDGHRSRCHLLTVALALQPPVSRYTPSPRPFPESLPPVEYDSGDLVRRVQAKGEISFRGREYLVGRGLAGLPVALRPAPDEEAAWDVLFCAQRLVRISLKDSAQGYPPAATDA